MTRRNLTTAFMVVSAGLLLFGGVTLAREAQTRDDRTNPALAEPTAAATRRQRRRHELAGDRR